jgi:hypothetical protein
MREIKIEDIVKYEIFPDKVVRQKIDIEFIARTFNKIINELNKLKNKKEK